MILNYIILCALMKKCRVFYVAIIFLISNSGARANNYYFSSAKGDDSRNSRQAQSPLTPWKTIARLNSFFSNLKAGDSVLFNRGEVFHGTIDVKKPGTAFLPIVISCYGRGNTPLISALVDLSAWAPLGGGIYESVCASCTITDKVLVINGNPQALGRYPNRGYLRYQSHHDNYSISDKTMPDLPNWTGADIVIRKTHWIIDRSNIVSQTGGVLRYASGTSSTPTDQYGYFLENDPRTLDQFGEWYFDSAKKKMLVFFGDKNPRAYFVHTSAENVLVNINGQGFIRFDSLSFEGANISTFRIIHSNNITVRNCRINISGTDAIWASASPNLTIENSVIDHSQNDAITLDSSCRAARIRNNYIRNTALMPGMGNSGTGTYQAISAFGENSLIELNEIDSTGYNGIYFGGNGTTAKNNLIRYFCLVKDDGAGIYIGDWMASTGKKIIGNIISDGIGAPAGTRPDNSRPPVEGIYIDDNSSGVDIQSNSVSNCPDAGIKIHNAHEVNIESNTLFNCGIQLLVAEDTFSSHSAVKNISCNQNIFFCKAAGQLCLNITSMADDLESFVRMDRNSYFQQVDNQAVIELTSKIWSSSGLTHDLSVSQWQERYKQDRQSKSISVKISRAAENCFQYNSSRTDKLISMKGTYISAGGSSRSNTFLLQPYHSVLFIKDGDSGF